jgi:hypothetical protein
MKKILLLFIYSSFLFSCNDKEDPVGCGVGDPVNDLA